MVQRKVPSKVFFWSEWSVCVRLWRFLWLLGNVDKYLGLCELGWLGAENLRVCVNR